ncbi:MAG TPA: hypothetical protein VGW74_01040 [Propionibacteriaceae bacterium]|nr:hypothetical protein [Propionibacteriaceae bacterium]
MRIVLSDSCAQTAGVFSVPVALDDDFPGCGCGGPCSDDDGLDGDDGELGQTLPTLTIRERLRDTFDFTGTPQLSWRTAGSGPAISYVERRETNDATGQTMVTAKAVLGWDAGVAAPKETAVVWDDAGIRWNVTSCEALPGRLELLMDRIDDSP